MKRFFLPLLMVILFASCKEEPTPPFNAQNVKSSIAPSKSGILGAVLFDYIELKNALVATDSKAANKSAVSMQKKLELVRRDYDSTITIKDLPLGLSVQMDSMKMQLALIISHDERNCEPQRIYFKYLSDNVYNFVKLYQLTNLKLYHQLCPMALNGKKAWWLSTSDKIENPYFGSKMLTCGELVDTLP